MPLEPNRPKVPLSNPSLMSGPHGPGVGVGVLVGEGAAVHVRVFVGLRVRVGVRVMVGVAVKVGNVPVGEMVIVGV